MSVVQRRFGYSLEVATPLVALAFSDTLVYYPLLTLVLPIRSRSRKLAPLGGLPASEYRRAQRRPLGNRGGPHSTGEVSGLSRALQLPKVIANNPRRLLVEEP